MAIRIDLSTRLGERRWTQAELSRATGIRPETIHRLHNEFADKISLEDLDLICEALECDISDILIRKENDPPLVKFRSGRPHIERDKPAKSKKKSK